MTSPINNSGAANFDHQPQGAKPDMSFEKVLASGNQDALQAAVDGLKSQVQSMKSYKSPLALIGPDAKLVQSISQR